MKEHEFTLVLHGVDDKTPNLEDALYCLGFDDALINFRNGTVYLDINRKAKTIKEAVLSAIQTIESSNLDARVMSVAPENFVSEAEIARRINKKKQAVSLWIKGLRRKTIPFPKPVLKISDISPLWRWHEVVAWLLQNDLIKEKRLLDEAIFIGNLNLVLEERMTPAKDLRADLTKIFSD